MNQPKASEDQRAFPRIPKDVSIQIKNLAYSLIKQDKLNVRFNRDSHLQH
jgi:hypothetical protein